ncbi:unnamed protein product [Triticum turgidum subsp. durum]|uniref:Non-haem dioxygenase N-terminal domain-containing protein n=2 Tax=Triticum turgidum subsp. durum TaxID=4567 RepID=A0A9R0WZK2_TRITD|nr:unnamed protein product [Triticum turgidum subsp. durum]
MASPPRSPGQSSGPCSEDGIPVVDLAVLVNGDAGERSQAVRHLGRACQDWGFFMVTNHGVPEALQSALMDACSELFSLPPEQKQEHTDAGPMDPVRVGTGFNSAVDGARYWRDYVKMFAHPELHCPAKPDSLRGVAAEYAARTRGLLLELTAAISESLGLHVGRIAERLDLGPASRSSSATTTRRALLTRTTTTGRSGCRLTPTTASSPCSSRTASMASRSSTTAGGSSPSPSPAHSSSSPAISWRL